MAKQSAEQAKTIAAKYKGNRWRVAKESNDLFQGCTIIRFFEDPKALKASIKELYEDYLAEMELMEDGRWTNADLVPIAAVGLAGSRDAKPKEFIDEATGFLLYDGKKKNFLYANTDEWEDENRLDSLDKLGLHESDAEDEDDDAQDEEPG